VATGVEEGGYLSLATEAQRDGGNDPAPGGLANLVRVAGYEEGSRLDHLTTGGKG